MQAGLRAGVAIAGIVLVSSASPPTGASPAGDPIQLTLVPEETDSREWINIVATGFPEGMRVLVQLCGSANADALERCDVESTLNAVADDAGAITVPFRVNPPESECPCYVEVTTADARASVVVQAPLSVDGIDGAAIGRLGATPSSTAQPLKVVHADISAEEWTSWFGTGSSRTLTYTLENTADTPMVVGEVQLLGGLGNASPLPSSPVGVLDAGARRTFRVDIPVGPLEWGEYDVTGQVPSAKGPIVFEAEASFRPPWALVAIGVVAAEVVLLLAWRSFRQRNNIDFLVADPALARRVSRTVVADTVLDRNAPQIASSIVGRVLGKTPTTGVTIENEEPGQS